MEVHPHFSDAKRYPFFMVLTQTCDLVRRGGENCKSRYISLSAVRDFEEILCRAIVRYQYSALEKQLGFANSRRKPKLRQFLERLFNNNELEFFYLAEQPDLGLDHDCCAVLQVSIALRAELHYDTILDAKIVQLSESFEHKLGHLVGSSYSRVATEDWVPDHASKQKFDDMVESNLDRDDLVVWIEEGLFAKALKGLKKLPVEEQSLESLEEIVGGLHQAREVRKEAVLKTVAATMQECDVSDSVASTVCGRLRSDSDFGANIR